LFFLGTSVCFYRKANARVNVLSLEEEADNDHFRATIKDLQSQEDTLIPQVNYLNALEAGKSQWDESSRNDTRPF
jgi:hypothetical protein